MSTAIIGSCVTRDAYDFEKVILPSPFLFFARTSFATIHSEPIGIVEAGLPRKWENRMIEAELQKTHFSAIGSINPKYMIFDFIDERFDLISIGDSLINRSFAVVKCGHSRKARRPQTHCPPF